MDGRATDGPLIDQRRYVAALHLRGGTLAEVARRTGRTQRHLQFILRGERTPSAELLSALRDAVGPEGWNFATRQADELPDPLRVEAAARAA